MAALTTQSIVTGAAITVSAAAGGGDTIEASTTGGGWSIAPVFVLATVGTTATTITVDGTPYGPFTSQTVVIRVPHRLPYGTRVNISYNQVVGVSVGAIRLGPTLPA